jgi:hypothetical protein
MTNAAAVHPRAIAWRFSLCIAVRQRSADGSGRLVGIVDNARRRRRRLGCECSSGCVNTCTSVMAMDASVWRRSKQGGLKKVSRAALWYWYCDW